MNIFKLKMFSNIILILLLISICVSLILTNFSNYYFNKKQDYVVKINDQLISLEEFIQRYHFEDAQRKKKLNYTNIYNVKNKKYNAKLVQITLSKIINETLLKQYIKKLNFSVNNVIIKNYIYHQSIFQTKNSFDKKKYFNYLSVLKINSNEYIKNIQTYLEIQELINMLFNTDFILQNEINIIIKLLSQVRTIRKTLININEINKKQYINKNITHKYHNINKDFYTLKKKSTKEIIENIIYELNNNSKNLFHQFKLKFGNLENIYRFNNDKLSKTVFSLPYLTSNKKIYFSYMENNQTFLCEYSKTFYIEPTQKQKKIVISSILKYHTTNILNAILNNLYVTANISYGKYSKLNTLKLIIENSYKNLKHF